jgi:hypothetical protein
MGKVVDITEKLSMEENPIIVIKGEELEVNADAETVLKIMGMMGNEDDITAKDVLAMCNLIFTEEAKEKLGKLKLSFKDYSTAIMQAVSLAIGDDGESVGELTTPATT